MSLRGVWVSVFKGLKFQEPTRIPARGIAPLTWQGRAFYRLSSQGGSLRPRAEKIELVFCFCLLGELVFEVGKIELVFANATSGVAFLQVRTGVLMNI